MRFEKIKIAGMTDFNAIYYMIESQTTISDYSQVRVYDGDNELGIKNISSFGKSSFSGTITVEGTLDISKIYELEIDGFEKKIVVPTKVFDTEKFLSHYVYDGNDLGAIINGINTTFKVWAPTALKVFLNLFDKGDGGEAYKTVEMSRGEKGVWAHVEECNHGTYYTFTVTTSVGTQEATDPYGKAVGVNGNRSMVVDLSKTSPIEWKRKFKSGMTSYLDAIIWEVHVRDFSNKIKSSKYKGKYLAFTETGLKNSYGVSVGIDYLVNLGITHVHLLPVSDYETVDESASCSEFNWGYDPKNYNVPEGSYSTNPFDGEVRIREFKQMVQALHNVGIGVVLDVVYNHTYDANNSLNRIVPYYYYRYEDSGKNSSCSGCGNDIASERYMCRKFIVDSVSYWANEYNIDGFRFDLMGLHDIETMKRVEECVHDINPEAIIYGEGWSMGYTIDGAPQANQSNMGMIPKTKGAIGSIAVFNDVMRDGLKGSVFDKHGKGFISGASVENLSKVIFGINGGIGGESWWSVNDSMVINYMSSHDNNTLWDKLLLSNTGNNDDDRNKMNNLGAAIIIISKGTPFWQAGEEMLRTKNCDENSYKSGDHINNIDWEVLNTESRQYKTMLYYKGLIEMRKSFDIFTDPKSVILCEPKENGILAVTFKDEHGEKAKAIINPYNKATLFTLDEMWNLVADSTKAGRTVISQDVGEILVDPISIRIYVKE